MAPLVLRFDTDKAVYPLALTATAGADTQILLYTVTEQKVTCGEGLKLRYARGNHRGVLDVLYGCVEPLEFFADAKIEGDFLCKFKGTLTPEQMRQDLVLTPAPDNTPYREHIIGW